jgi:hypothetical protein
MTGPITGIVPCERGHFGILSTCVISFLGWDEHLEGVNPNLREGVVRYRRMYVKGGIYLFTVVTYQRGKALN